MKMRFCISPTVKNRNLKALFYFWTFSKGESEFREPEACSSKPVKEAEHEETIAISISAHFPNIKISKLNTFLSILLFYHFSINERTLRRTGNVFFEACQGGWARNDRNSNTNICKSPHYQYIKTQNLFVNSVLLLFFYWPAKNSKNRKRDSWRLPRRPNIRRWRAGTSGWVMSGALPPGSRESSPLRARLRGLSHADVRVRIRGLIPATWTGRVCARDRAT